MMEWNDIKSAPPPHNEVVLLYWKDWSGAEYMEATRFSTGERLPSGYSSYSQHSYATHWLPLPPQPKEQPMTKLSDRLEALAEKATSKSIHPEDVAAARFQLKTLLQDNLPTILQALKDKDL